MFTGLVHTTATVCAAVRASEGLRLCVVCKLAPEHRREGASISVDGACLTVVSADAENLEFFLAFETLEKTTLGAVSIGQVVNIEPSLRMGDPLGGHLVSGHVDGVATLRSKTQRGEAVEMWFDAPPHTRRYLAVKGCVCLSGVSLTINEVDAGGFMVGVVPHTLKVTNLGTASVGAAVNLEVDLLARYVERIVAAGPASDAGAAVTLKHLQDAGFLESSS